MDVRANGPQRAATVAAATVAAVTAAFAGLVLSGCADAPQRPAVPDTASADLLETLAVGGYRTWAAPPTSADLPRRRAASGPHGAWVEVYLDPVLLAAFDSGESLEQWPVGVAAVCEGYADEEAAEPQLFNVMVKEDYGWRWAQLDASGRALDGGGTSDCVGCHAAADDFVFSLFLRD